MKTTLNLGNLMPCIIGKACESILKKGDFIMIRERSASYSRYYPAGSYVHFLDYWTYDEDTIHIRPTLHPDYGGWSRGDIKIIDVKDPESVIQIARVIEPVIRVMMPNRKPWRSFLNSPPDNCKVFYARGIEV